jgi:hypothetical protein
MFLKKLNKFYLLRPKTIFYTYVSKWGWDSIATMATFYSWMVQGPNPSGGDIFCTHPDCP